MSLPYIFFNNLSAWHRSIFEKLLNSSFKGRNEIYRQLLSARFEVIDTNQSLNIIPLDTAVAPVEKTIPVEAHGKDGDGCEIQVLLFTRNGVAYMLEVIREDGLPVEKLPAVDTFEVMILAP